MLKVHVRKLLPFTPQQLIENLSGDFTLVFDDNSEVATNERQVIYSSFIWEFFRKFPEVPVLPRHHLASVMKNGSMPANAHLQLLRSAIFDTIAHYGHRVENSREFSAELSRMAYEATNEIYNVMSQHCEEFITTLDITDFVELACDPDLQQALSTMVPTQDGVEEVMDLCKNLLHKSPKYASNPVVHAVRRGISREAQLLQMIGVRGFTTDIDSNIFKYPITGNYIFGVRQLYESMIESRSAAKALANSEKPLQDSEYFSRRQQLIGMMLRDLEPGDCGSQKYLRWMVRDAQYENGVKVLNSDLNTIYGKWYLDETTGKLRIVGKDDRHLIGKTILLRDAVAGCNSRNPYGICEVCFGTSANAVTPGANIGHATIVALTSPLGQNILSTKHFDGSSRLEPVVLKGLEKTYLDINDAGTYFTLSPSLKNRNMRIHIAQHQFEGMPDVINGDNVAELSPFRISRFDSFILEVATRGGSDLIPLEAKAHSRWCSLSPQMLEHIKKQQRRDGKGYTIETNTATGESWYVIELDSTWDISKPIFVLPMSHFNMSDHQSEIAGVLESTANEMQRRSDTVSPDAMLVELHDLVNRRLNVHLAVLSPILLASMVVSATDGEYDFPRAYTRRGVGVMRNLLANRSLSAMMAFQNHHNVLASPAAYMAKDRPDHPFDAVLVPKLLNNPKFRAQYRK